MGPEDMMFEIELILDVEDSKEENKMAVIITSLSMVRKYFMSSR